MSSEANDSGARADAGASAATPSLLADSSPHSFTIRRFSSTARQPELSQIPEEPPPMPRRDTDDDTEVGNVVETIVSEAPAPANSNHNAWRGISEDSLQSSKRDNQTYQQSSQRSLISDSSAHQVDGPFMEDDNDIDSLSVSSRRSAWSRYSHVTGASDWSVGAEPDESRVTGLVRRWDVMIPTDGLTGEGREEHGNGDPTLTKSALDRLSQQQSEDGAIGRLSRTRVKHNTAMAERLAHQIKTEMAWWKNHGLDMNATSLLEMPAPFATLEEGHEVQSSFSSDMDWWNKNYKFEDDLSDTPGKLEGRWDQRRQEETPHVTNPKKMRSWSKTTTTPTSRLSSDDDRRLENEIKAAQAEFWNSVNESKGVLTPLHQPEVVDLKEKEAFTSFESTDDPAKTLRQLTPTDEHGLPSLVDADNLSQDDAAPVVSDSSSSGDVMKGDDKTAKPLEAITVHAGDVDDVGVPLVTPLSGEIIASSWAVDAEKTFRAVGRERKQAMRNDDVEDGGSEEKGTMSDEAEETAYGQMGNLGSIDFEANYYITRDEPGETGLIEEDFVLFKVTVDSHP